MNVIEMVDSHLKMKSNPFSDHETAIFVAKLGKNPVMLRFLFSRGNGSW